MRDGSGVKLEMWGYLGNNGNGEISFEGKEYPVADGDIIDFRFNV